PSVLCPSSPMPSACVIWNCECASDARMLGYNRLSSIEWRLFSAGCGKLCWYARTSMVRTCGTTPVCLVHLVTLMQPNKPDKPNRPNEQDSLADFFSSLLERTVACCDPISHCES